MDRFGTLPLALEALKERLEGGQIFSVHGNDGLSYALFLDGEGRIVFQQGDQHQPFRQLEVAVLTLLNCVGEFSSSVPPAALADGYEIDARIVNIIVEVFDVEPGQVVANVSFDDLDMDGFGLDLLDLVVRLEEQFAITISDDDAIAHMKTVGGVQQYLRQRGVL